MKQYIITSLFILGTLFSIAQNKEFEKSNFPDRKEEFKIANKEFEIGNEQFEVGPTQYKNAIKHYKRAYAFNPKSALLNYKMGLVYMQLEEYKESMDHLKQAYQLNPSVSEEILYHLGTIHHLNELWDEAMDYFRQQKQKTQAKATGKNAAEANEKIRDLDHLIDQCINGKKLSANPVRVFIDNISKPVNTAYPEYGAQITADGSMIYFTSRRPGSTGAPKETVNTKGKDVEEIDYAEDIYYSVKIKNGGWGTPVNIGSPINTNVHDAMVSLSPDGQLMLVYVSDNNGDIFQSELKGEMWSKPKSIGKTINTDFHETSATFSIDKKILYFVSNKPEDNLGGHDIFYSVWDEKKMRWGEPKNIGPTINTPWDEESVFMHPDGKTLYFSSEGHSSIGGHDIFKSVFEDGKWSTPENMGYPVNGPSDDVFFVVSGNGRRGFYASDTRAGEGEQDLYMLTFLGPEKQVILNSEDNLLAGAKPVSEKVIEPTITVTTAKTTILKGKTLDAMTLKPVEAKIDLIDNSKNQVVATFASNSKTGNFLISLPSGRNYGIAVVAENYLFHSENFDIPDSATYQEIYKEIHLKNIGVGNSIVLKNIFYDYAKATLRPESIPELDRLVQLLNDVPNIKIEIAGHTDNRGAADYNQKLSENRAKSVVDYLIGKGISAGRLTFKGYGFTKPIATNNTDAGRQENRRTEFTIIAN